MMETPPPAFSPHLEDLDKPLDTGRLVSTGDPVADIYFAAASLTRPAIDWLVKTHGVPGSALADDGFVLRTARVVFTGMRFDVADEGVSALLILARDCSGDVADLVAWTRDGQIATLLGRVSVLGEHVLFGPESYAPIPVCATPLEWLQAGRAGIVILDAERAGRTLIEAPARIKVANKAEAKRVAAIMTRPCRLERIVLPVAARRAAA